MSRQSVSSGQARGLARGGCGWAWLAVVFHIGDIGHCSLAAPCFDGDILLPKHYMDVMEQLALARMFEHLPVHVIDLFDLQHMLLERIELSIA